MTVYKWSQTADDNATADGTINWAEGMAPSAVNNSARAMMAAVAKWRSDNAGSLTTGGSSTAYTLTSNQVFDSLTNMSGQSLRVKFHATNGASATLQVDSPLGAKALQTVAGTALPAGYITANSVHDLVYDNTNSAWIVVTPPYPFPSTTAMVFQQTTAPGGWTKASTHNNKALRLVTGTASSGGSTAFTSVFASRSIETTNLPSHTHGAGSYATGAGSAHNHEVTIYEHNAGSTTGPQKTTTGGNTSTVSTGSENSHTHSSVSGTSGATGSGTAMDFAVQYVDVIIATKD